SNRSWPADTTARGPHNGAAKRSGLRDTRAHGHRSRNTVRWRFAGLSIPWPVPRSSERLAPSPGTTVSVSRAGSALPGFDPAPAVCPIHPALGNAVVPATGSAPAPSNPAAGRGSRCRKIPWAVGTTELYSSAVLPPTGPAAPAALHLARRRRWLETRSAPTPAQATCDVAQGGVLLAL